MTHRQRAERVEGVGKQARHRGLARAGIAEELELIVKLDRSTGAETLALLLKFERYLAYLLLYLVDTHIFVERLHHLLVRLGYVFRAVDHVGTRGLTFGEYTQTFQGNLVCAAFGIMAAGSLGGIGVTSVVQVYPFQLLPSFVAQSAPAVGKKQPFGYVQQPLVAQFRRL